jgi:hypothetical protein
VTNITPTADPSAATHFKADPDPVNADQFIVPSISGPAEIYFYNSAPVNGVPGWFRNGRRVTGSNTVPSGAGVFIRKSSGSTLQSFTPPAE